MELVPSKEKRSVSSIHTRFSRTKYVNDEGLAKNKILVSAYHVIILFLKPLTLLKNSHHS